MTKTPSQRSMESRQKNSDQIQFTVPKGERETIKSHADRHGISMNEFIRQAIREKMERENEDS